MDDDDDEKVEDDVVPQEDQAHEVDRSVVVIRPLPSGKGVTNGKSYKARRGTNHNIMCASRYYLQSNM